MNKLNVSSIDVCINHESIDYKFCDTRQNNWYTFYKPKDIKKFIDLIYKVYKNNEIELDELDK